MAITYKTLTTMHPIYCRTINLSYHYIERVTRTMRTGETQNKNHTKLCLMNTHATVRTTYKLTYKSDDAKNLHVKYVR